MALQKNPGAVALFSLIARFALWLQQLPHRITPPPFRLVQIGAAFWQSRALYLAARLDLASLIGDAPLAIDALAARAGVAADGLYRLLRMLAALGIFAETAPRVFANNRLSRHLRADHPGSVRAMILMHNSATMSKPWYEQLEPGLRSGEVPFRLAHGHDLYHYMDLHPEFDALFAEAMDSLEAVAGDSFATDFDWGRFDRVIDVGGSKGSKSLSLLKCHAHLRALVVDRPGIIEQARQHWPGRQSPALLARLEFAAGNLFGPLPAAGPRDIYLLSAVLHGFDDAACLAALRNLAAACANGATVALLEAVMPSANADPASTAMDMQMFMACRGRERTLAEWTQLFDAAGLRLVEQVGLRAFASILVLRTAAPAGAA